MYRYAGGEGGGVGDGFEVGSVLMCPKRLRPVVGRRCARIAAPPPRPTDGIVDAVISRGGRAWRSPRWRRDRGGDVIGGPTILGCPARRGAGDRIGRAPPRRRPGIPSPRWAPTPRREPRPPLSPPGACSVDGSRATITPNGAAPPHSVVDRLFLHAPGTRALRTAQAQPTFPRANVNGGLVGQLHLPARRLQLPVALLAGRPRRATPSAASFTVRIPMTVDTSPATCARVRLGT